MLQLLVQNYKTYINTARGNPERHSLRLVFFGALSLFFALFADETTSSVYSMMATGITVLTGFTFTALFSDQALASYGLPKPQSENDRHDLVRLEALSKNFRARSSYFITLSIFEIVLLAAVSFDFAVPDAMKTWPVVAEWSGSLSSKDWFSVAQAVVSVLFVAFEFVINFIYLECLYTFYRMAETILAILDTRRNYLTSDHEGES